MLIDVTAKAVCKIDIDSYESFRLLCRALKMGFVLDEDLDYFVMRDINGDPKVYILEAGDTSLVDDRGELFIALRNVAVQMFPNTSFRSADYIYKFEE